MSEPYQRYGLKQREWIGFSSAAERYKAKQWRVGFCILICLLAIVCVLAAL